MGCNASSQFLGSFVPVVESEVLPKKEKGQISSLLPLEIIIHS